MIVFPPLTHPPPHSLQRNLLWVPRDLWKRALHAESRRASLLHPPTYPFTHPPTHPPTTYREILFGCLAIFGRELFMREVAVQISTLPPPMQEKSYLLMNRTMTNLQDKVRDPPTHSPILAVAHSNRLLLLYPPTHLSPQQLIRTTPSSSTHPPTHPPTQTGGLRPSIGRLLGNRLAAHTSRTPGIQRGRHRPTFRISRPGAFLCRRPQGTVQYPPPPQNSPINLPSQPPAIQPLSFLFHLSPTHPPTHPPTQVFPDLPLDEWNRNVESLGDRTKKFWMESQMKVGRWVGG